MTNHQTNYQRIYRKLKEHNLNPYAVGVHQGICTKPYIVIREVGQIPMLGDRKCGKDIIELIVFVPFKQYTRLEPYKNQARRAMLELDFIKETGIQTIATTDNDRQATSSSVQYEVLKKIGGCL